MSPCSATLVTPYDLVETARLPDAVFGLLAERMQKPEEMHVDRRYTSGTHESDERSEIT